MSAIPRIATELMRRNELTRSAIRDPMHRSKQRAVSCNDLLDHLVGKREQPIRDLATSPSRLTSTLRGHGAWNISTPTALATSPFSLASRRSCGRATTTLRSSVALLILALPTPSSGQQTQSSHAHSSEDHQCAQ